MSPRQTTVPHAPPTVSDVTVRRSSPVVAREELTAWVLRAVRGEQAAYGQLFRLLAPSVRRLVLGFSALDMDEVDDVVQETFARAFRSLAGLQQPRMFEAWLFTIARNRALSALDRKQAKDNAIASLRDQAEPAIGAFPEALLVERDIGLVRRLISALPEGEEKKTVELFYVQGELSAREIAEQLGVGKSAVTMRLERFRSRIKRELLQQILATRPE